LSEFLIVAFPTRNQALHSVGEYAQDIALLHDEELRTVDFDFGPDHLPNKIDQFSGWRLGCLLFRPRSSRRKVRRMKPPSFRQNRPAIGKLHMAVPEGIVTDFWEMD
jgi:hypothetical protein